jgi:hypothetical protein
MKTSALSPLRVSAELRADAEAVVAPGESLSSFVHDAPLEIPGPRHVSILAVRPNVA